MSNTAQSIDEFKRGWDQFNKRREAVRKKNEKLIAEWRAIPWWRFWERPSFDEQRMIIINNWRKLNYD